MQLLPCRKIMAICKCATTEFLQILVNLVNQFLVEGFAWSNCHWVWHICRYVVSIANPNEWYICLSGKHNASQKLHQLINYIPKFSRSFHKAFNGDKPPATNGDMCRELFMILLGCILLVRMVYHRASSRERHWSYLSFVIWTVSESSGFKIMNSGLPLLSSSL